MVYDILPTENLEFQDIRDTLAAGGGSVNNTMSSLFTEAANINKWSKHKPVKLPVNFCQDFDSSAPNYDADWWKAKGTTYGISVPYQPLSESALRHLAYRAYNGDADNYTYLIPTGTSSEPFRLGDFAGYKRYATEPFKTGISGYPVYSKNQKEPIEVNMFSTEYLNFYTSRTDSNDISLYDLIELYDDYYLVIEACDDTNLSTPWYINPLYKYRSTSAITTNDQSAWFKLKLDGSYQGKTIMFIIGIQRYNDDEYEAGTGFIAPWKDDGSSYPFMCYMKFVNYFDRHLDGISMRLNSLDSTEYPLPNLDYVYTVNSSLYIKFKLSRDEKRLLVVSNETSYSPSGVSKVRFRAKTQGNTAEITGFGYPMVLNPEYNYLQKTDYIDIPSGNTDEYTEFYLEFRNLLLNNGDVNSLIIESSIDNGSTWVNATSMSVYLKKHQ